MRWLKQIKQWMQPRALQRGYKDVLAIGGQNSDWIQQYQSEDSDVWQNAYALTGRMRDLFRTNRHYIRWREHLWSQVFGPNGIMTRYKIKENEDRVIHTPDEKSALIEHERRINRLRRHAELMGRSSFVAYRCYTLADRLERSKEEDVITRQALVKVGEPDIFAIRLVENNKKEWEAAQYSDIRGRFNYKTHRLIRLISAVRDGDIFIRMIMNPKVNKFGFSLQLINGEWCDRFLNVTLDNGNEVRMGIEYESTDWGIGKPVAYYFIKRLPKDWQYQSMGGLFGYGADRPANMHQRIPASEIIHYARPVDADGTRPAPWAASTIASSRQLDQAMLAEVIAWRESACKTGFYKSTILPEGGYAQVDDLDPRTGISTEALAPGEIRALKYGVEYQDRNPTHPNANVEQFRKAAMRDMAAGMPGASYSALSNDYESINFSAGRLDKLGTNDACEMLQTFDIDAAERMITERLLEMSLVTGAIPLPLVKFDKFNKAVFSGRRWPQVDEVKSEQASAMRITNNKSSWGIECALDGKDFDEVLLEKAEDIMKMEELGISPSTTVDSATNQTTQDDASNDPGTGQPPKTGTTPAAKKPAKALTNGNGHAPENLERISIPITFPPNKSKRKIAITRDAGGRITGAEAEQSDD